ncbi:MAG: hypothetical protein K0S58_1286, partial [Nitrospira sp.]|nr:hypothetical protein [Nitrospira sp.]
MQDVHPLDQSLIGLHAATRLPPLPGVEPAPAHLQDATHAGQPKLLLIHLHEPVLHWDSLAKYMAVSSTDHCNTLWDTVEWEGDCDGTDGTSGLVCG